MKRSLEELAAGYTAAAHILTGRIAERRRKLETLSPASRKASAIKGELRILYAERRDALEIAQKLTDYYS